MAFLIQRGHEFAHGLEGHLFRNVPVGQAVLAEEHVHVVERRVRVDADAFQRLRVGVAGMPRNVEDQHGPVGHHRVELPLGRAAPLRDVGIVEIVDHDPVAVPHPFGLLADQGVHVLEVRDARTAAVRFPHGIASAACQNIYLFHIIMGCTEPQKNFFIFFRLRRDHI